MGPGEYRKETFPDGHVEWFGCTPNGHQCGLARHTVTEEVCGAATVREAIWVATVAPSILVSDDRGPLWHGYLEHGVWREC